MKKTKIYKRIVSMFMTFILLLSLIPSVQAVSFSDVSKSNGFYDEINYLVEKGIIQGFQDGTFKPNNYVTRAQAAIMIGRALGLDGTQKNTKFPDVSKESVASGYIQSAVNSGIIQGYSDGTFKPNQSVTRGQMAIFLSRAFNLQKTSNVTFSDVSSSMVAYPYIGRLIAAGITNGYTDGTYRPNKAVTRGEFSAFMARALDSSFRLPVEEGNLVNVSVPGFENVDLGMTKQQVKNIETATLIKEENNKLVYENKKVLGYTAVVEYKFENDKLTNIVVLHLLTVDQDVDTLNTYFVVMYNELVKIYGNPVYVDTDWLDDGNVYMVYALWESKDQSAVLNCSIELDFSSSYGGIVLTIK